MVELDNDGRGLVTLRFHQPYAERDEADYLTALERLSNVPGPYVLLAIFGGGPGLTQEGERTQALWFKHNHLAIAERCHAMAVTRPGATEKMAEVFRKLWGFPLLTTPDEAQARRFLEQYRPKRPVA